MELPELNFWQHLEPMLDAIELQQIPDEHLEEFVRAYGPDNPIFNKMAMEFLATYRSVPEHSTTLFDLTDPLLNKQVGPYLLIERLGQGGMGTVYRAQRVDGQFQHQVALKIIRRDLGMPDALNRFRHERQVLARLNHPDIARLYDGGVTDEGLPYFAMELVDGQPLTDYCRKRQVSIEARLALFLKVCDAVQYAHQNLVVHRDLKPSNILVWQENGGHLRVKLLDFGIAKVLDEEDELTRTGMHPMTVKYASPEQVLGDSITTSTDVYTLGVILYELLSGHLPYRTEGKGQDEWKRVVSQVSPKPPSLVARLEAGKDSAVDYRKIAGELDVICLMALRKEMSRRYSSVEVFAEDVRRYQKQLPLVAQADTWTYRARKFSQRHFRSLAAALAVIVIIGALTTYYTHQLAEERDIAQMEAAKAEQVTAFMMDMFATFDPHAPTSARNDSMRINTYLDLGTRRVKTSLRNQPDVQAMLLDVLAQVYMHLDDYDTSSLLIKEAISLQEKIPGNKNKDLGSSLVNLARVLHAQSRYAEAEYYCKEALEIQRELFGHEHPVIARTLDCLALMARSESRYDEAEAFSQKALGIQRKLLGNEHLDIARSLNTLAIIYSRQGKLTMAEPLYREALRMRRNLLGDDHALVGTVMNNLATTLRKLGRYSEAEELCLETLEMRKKLLGEEHTEIGTSLTNLARVLQKQGRFEKADSLYRVALTMFRKLQGDEHTDIARTLNYIGTLIHDRGDYIEAEIHYREALKMRQKLLVADHPDIARSLHNIARLLHDQGNYLAADSLYLEALQMLRHQFGNEHPDIARNIHDLARLRYDQGNYAEAESLQLESVEIALIKPGKKHPFTSEALEFLVYLYDRSGKSELAASYRAKLTDQ